MEDVIKILKGSIYQIDNLSSNAEKIVFRLPLMTEEEMDSFRTALSKSTNTRWNLYYNRTKGKSLQKKWVCHLSRYRKTASSKRNTDCPAKLDIRVKDLMPISVERDVFLQHDPPLRTVITISLKHSHSTDTPAALKLMKVSPEMQLKFFTYFEDGITPREAKSLHEDELFSLQKCEDLADCSENPTIRQVYYLHDLWRESIVTSEISGENSWEVNGESASNEALTRENVLKEFSRVENLLKDVPTDLANNLIQTFKKIQTLEDLKKLTVLKSINRSRKIRVQPTSISRRQEGLTKRNSRVPSGRPSRLNDKKKQNAGGA